MHACALACQRQAAAPARRSACSQPNPLANTYRDWGSVRRISSNGRLARVANEVLDAVEADSGARKRVGEAGARAGRAQSKQG